MSKYCFECDDNKCYNYNQDVVPLRGMLCSKSSKDEVEDHRAYLIKLALKGKDLVSAPVITRNISLHYEFVIGIGKDHHMTVTIDKDAYKELLK